MRNELDKELEKRGLRFVRYADDHVIAVRSEASAKRVMDSITDWIERKLGLKVNAEKTHITRPQNLKYLGFGFWKDGKSKKWKYRLTDKKTEEIRIEERYYLCSIKPIAELFALAVRRHWKIENNLHWTLDVVFKEDRLDSKEKKAVHNLGLIRRFVMFIIKLMKAYDGRSMRRVRKTFMCLF